MEPRLSVPPEAGLPDCSREPEELSPDPPASRSPDEFLIINWLKPLEALAERCSMGWAWKLSYMKTVPWEAPCSGMPPDAEGRFARALPSVPMASARSWRAGLGAALMAGHHGWLSSLMSSMSPAWAMSPRCM